MNEQIGTWEALLVGVLALGLVWWLAPGVKRALENRPTAAAKDWLGLGAVLALVVLFVIVLIALV
jgi:hypothetical protein